MRKEKLSLDIPETNNAVLAIKLDTKKKTEEIIIDDLEKVSQFAYYGQSEDLIFKKTYPITSLITEISSQSRLDKINFLEILRIHLLDEPNNKREAKNNRMIIINMIEELFNSDSYVNKYLAMKFWELYKSILVSGVQYTSNKNITWDKIDGLTLPFRSGIINSLLETQKYSYNYKFPYPPLRPDIYDFHMYPIQMFFSPKSTSTKGKFYDIEEIAFTDFSLLPLLDYYQKVIYEEKKFLRYCKVCGKLFLASDANKTTICSKVCKKKQIKQNTINYNEKHKNDPTKKTYINSKAYWQYRINKAINLNIDDCIIAELMSAFITYKNSALEKKRQAQDGEIDFSVFNTWILEERNTIDNLMEKYDIK